LFADLTSIRSDLTVIAHSMGNHLALDMVRSWRMAHPNADVPIKRLIMAAPDVDRSWFITSAGRELGVDVTIYASTRDQPLSASWRSHGYARAGDLSKRVTGHDTSYPNDQLTSATVVDTSDVSAGIGHADFIETAQGAADLCRIVNAPTTNPSTGRRGAIGHPNLWLLLKTPEKSDECTQPGSYGASIATGKWRSGRARP
jgi:esterase/lipase superfamily enzyme